MIYKFLLRGILVVCFILAFTVNMNAQALSEMPVTEEYGTWEPIAGTYLTNGDDNEAYLSMPFPFVYDNQNITYLYVSTNGFLSLNWLNTYLTVQPGYYYSGYNTVAWMGRDLYTYGGVYYQVSGTAPSRVLTIQWNDVAWYSPREASMYAQIKLFEGTNAVQMIHGPGCNNFPGSHYAYVFFGGMRFNYYAEAWNMHPDGNTPSNYVDGYGNPGVNWCPQNNYTDDFGYSCRTYFLTQNTKATLVPGHIYTLGQSKPKIEEMWPSADVTLIRGNIYGNGTVDALGQGNEQRPMVMLSNVDGTNPSEIHYQISGPVRFPVHPNYHIIYDATNTFTVSDAQLNMSTATVPLEDPGDNKGFGAAGNLDLATFAGNIYGGVYQVNATLDDGEDVDEMSQSINIAYNTNLEITGPIDPKSINEKRYPNTARIPVRVKYTNRGLSEISEFWSVAYIYDENENIIWEDSVYWEAEEGQELQIGQSVDLTFEQFRAPSVGTYRLFVFIDYPGDEEEMDDTYPWSGGGDHYFVVAPEIEAEALAVIRPNNLSELNQDIEIYVGRPIEPLARFQNNGITDISDAPSTMTITRLSDMEIVYTDNTIIPDIPQGMAHNVSDMFYSDFIPPSAGDYMVCVEVNAEDDEISGNNTVCDTFTVIDALNGIYTVGPDQNTGDAEADSIYNARNFTTVQAALDEMYLRGLTGPVEFHFTSDTYTVGDPMFSSTAPAMDLRSKVVGMNEVNTVTFRPSQAKSISKSAVTINLYSGGGIGVLFGQSTSTDNRYSVVNEVKTNSKKSYANPEGNFIFDGGSQKAIKFVMHSSINFSTVFYLSQGASNVTVANCVINNNDAATSWQHYSLPLTRFNEPQYLFDADVRSSGTDTYTAGVMVRSVPPIDKIDFYDNTELQDINLNSLDTLVNRNNTISNNEISGFAYGVVSIGIGPLLKDGLPRGYYNHDNTISGNLIKNVSRAGIFLGFEHNTTVSNNKIAGVANSTTGYNAGSDVAGIILGGEKKTIYNGYNNTQITIDGNEISNIGAALNDASNRYVDGIKIDQCKNSYQSVDFPDIDENMLIANNAIWGLVSNHANTNRCGIRLTTLRNTALGDWYSIFKTPFDAAYWTVNDRIVNNTILMRNDGFNSAGITAALSIQNSYEPFVYNNAIAMMDDNIAGNTNQYAAIFYQGMLPYEDGGINADRNVYWLKNAGSPTDSASVVRYIQTNESSTIISEGTRTEFLTMNQWQMFSGEDFKSVRNDFTGELTTPDIDIATDELRIDNSEGWPEGSALNNRADLVDDVIYDIDMNYRGSSGQKPDIGAFEFPGRLLNSDVEITTAFQPGAYKSSVSTSQTFSEAEYIMTTAPVEVKAELRNNGSLAQSGIDVKVQIYRQQPRANFTDPVAFYDTPELEETVFVTIPPSETYQVEFNLADAVGKEFYPTTYGEWFMKYNGKTDYTDSMYTMPAWFETMKENVTPLYRILISVRSDEDNFNNTFEKTCRFYIKKSVFNMLVSAEHSSEPFTNDEVNAGKRNYDSLVAYLEDLGWENQWITDEGPDTTLMQYFDVFERTAWEPRAVNYEIYNTVFWSDGDDDAITRQQMLDLNEYLEAGTQPLKNNLIIASQEMVRENHALYTEFVEEKLSATLDASYPTDPMNGPAYVAGDAQPTWNVTDDTKWIEGVALGRAHQMYVMNTGILPGDPDPVPGLMTLYTGGEGQAQVAFTYNPDQCVELVPGEKETTMGTATTTLTRNVILLGVDWRHYADGEFLMRAILDYLNKNDARIIPVELLSFNADVIGNNVGLAWETATEYNTDRFVIERADLSASGMSQFTKVGEVDAAGNSEAVLNYNFTDKGLAYNSAYVYRLRMVDLNGEYEYSNEVAVETGDGLGVSLGAPVPNPAVNFADVTFNLNEAANVEIALYDVNGKFIRTLYNDFAFAGANDVEFDLAGISSGVYTYVLRVGDKLVKNEIRIVK